jgi:hypothetical protein
MFLRRKMKIPNGETKEINTGDMWVVTWIRRYGEFSSNVTKCFQAFFIEQDAKDFKKSLDDANKLIGNTSQTHVSIEKQKAGL